jgi:methionyl-tRNA formyltransferase
MKIFFMGTPPFAVKVLEEIHHSNHQLVGVATSIDKPAGRGNKINQSAVKIFSLKHQLNLLQPEKLKDEKFVCQLKELKPDIIVVVAFRMLPEVVWKIPKLGTVNLHASVLPNYRGAAPINWAIINGEKNSGITTFFIDEKIDTGAVILTEKVSIDDGTTAGELHDTLMTKGAHLVLKTIETISFNYSGSKKQNDSLKLKLAPKLNRENTKINWNKSAEEIRQLTLGLNPYPGAWTKLSYNNKILNFKVFNAQLSNKKYPIKKLVITDDKLFVGTNGNALELTEIQIEGKKRMKTNEFLKGYSSIVDYSIL